jgi:hypothetical protein
MPDHHTTKKLQSYRTREAVGVFVNPAALEAAVHALENAGFDTSTISVLGSDDEIRKRVGHRYHRVAEIEDDTHAPRTSFVSVGTRLKGEMAAVVFPLYIGGLAGAAAVVAAGGALALAIAAAIMGSAAGSGLGGLLAAAIAEQHSKRVEEQLARGGLVLWVKVGDAAAGRRALAVLREAGAHDVHLHQIRHVHQIRREPGSGDTAA